MDLQLINAATTGNLPEVKRLVATGANPAAQNNYAIIWAASSGHLNVVQYLVTLPGVDPAAQNNRAIILASKYGHLKVVQFLVTLPGVDAAAKNNKAIAKAIGFHYVDVVRYLTTLPSVTTNMQDRVIFLSVFHDNRDVMIAIADSQGFNANTKDDVVEWVISKGYLYWLISHGNIREIKDLIEYYGADPGADNNHALIVAAGAGKNKIVRYLVTLPEVNLQDEIAIYAAEKNNHPELAEFLENYHN